MRKYEKEFRAAHPETIGETDKQYDLSNYADWLENRLEELERKAWECSVEMMDASFFNTEFADDPKCTRKDRHNGVAAGWKHAVYKLREAFGFPKSETPEKFKDVCPICNNRTVVNNVCPDCTKNLCKPFIGEV